MRGGAPELVGLIVSGLLWAGLIGTACVVPGDTPFAPADEIPPEILWTLPVDGVDGVPVDVHPQIRFSEALDWDAVTSDDFSLRSGAITASLSLDFGRIGQNVLVLVPAEPLVPDVQWTLTISGEITDAFFNPLGDDVAFTFRTDGDPEPFVLEESVPEDGAEDVPVDGGIRLTFSVPVAEPAVIRANFRLRTAEDGAVGYGLEGEDGGFAVILTPTRDLEPGAGYRVEVAADTLAVTGQRLGEAATVAFTTED